jgi:DNA modification methylase
MVSFEIEYVQRSVLHPNPDNPRRMDGETMEKLTHNIKHFGMVQPLVVRRADGVIIGGHQRYLAAGRTGLTEVPVVYVDVSEGAARVLGLALNQISGQDDETLLARLLATLSAEPGVDMNLTGFGEDDVQRYLKSLVTAERRERAETMDAAAAMNDRPLATRTKPGDLFRLGEHYLLCGDATDGAAMERLMQGRKAAMAFTDPPFNVDYGGGQGGRKSRRIANDHLPPAEWAAFVAAWVEQLLKYVEGACYVCMSCAEWPSVTQALADAGGHWSTTIIWSKDHFTLGRSDYQRQYEPLWYGWPEGGAHTWCGDRTQSDVWSVPRPTASVDHPTMKPLALVERAIENSSHVGDIVLDPFLGSGTTLIACERTGRICYGAELDPHYCDVVIARWQSLSGEEPVLL